MCSKVHITIYSPNGETVLDKDFDVSALGTYFGDLKLSDGAALGQYNVQITFANTGANATFTVAAYRAPEFEVVVTPQDKEIVRGQSHHRQSRRELLLRRRRGESTAAVQRAARAVLLPTAVGRQLQLERCR